MYSIHEHGDMISDRVRMEAHLQALRTSVRPGSVVLDLGAGVGIFALVSCQLGARCVYAIEMDEAIQVANSPWRNPVLLRGGIYI